MGQRQSLPEVADRNDILSRRKRRHRLHFLTFWEERSPDPKVPAVGRFSLEDPRPSERRGFAILEELVAALLKGTASTDSL